MYTSVYALRLWRAAKLLIIEKVFLLSFPSVAHFFAPSSVTFDE